MAQSDEINAYVDVELSRKRFRTFVFMFIVSLTVFVLLQSYELRLKAPWYEPVGIALIPALLLALFLTVIWGKILTRRVRSSVEDGSYVPRVVVPPTGPSVFQRIFTTLTWWQWLILIFVVIPAVILVIRSVNVNSNRSARIATMCDSVEIIVSDSSYTLIDKSENLGNRITGKLLINGSIRKSFSFAGEHGNVWTPIKSVVLTDVAFGDGPATTNPMKCNKKIYP